MRLRRPQITPALVISLVALFVSLGGTAYAAIVVSSNSQVAQNTIAGHQAITGIHSNLITGSVNATDLSAAYKTSVKAHCPSGLIAAADICVEPSLRPFATYTAALQTCAAAQRRLPDEGELALAFEHLGAPQQSEWAVSHFFNPSSSKDWAPTLSNDASRTVFLGSTGPVGGAGTVQAAYRCVTSPLN
jgi:hypothetical protein